MLSDHERETLADIEHRLLAEDPVWVTAFSTVGQRVSRRRAFEWVAHVVGLVLAGALAVLMLAAHAPGPALFFATVTGLLIWLIRRLCRRSRAPGTGPSDTAHPGSGLSGS